MSSEGAPSNNSLGPFSEAEMAQTTGSSTRKEPATSARWTDTWASEICTRGRRHERAWEPVVVRCIAGCPPPRSGALGLQEPEDQIGQQHVDDAEEQVDGGRVAEPQ